MQQVLARLSLLAVLILSGCAHSIHQVYVSSMDKGARYGKGEWVTAESKAFVILSFQFETDYVEQAYRELESKCSGRLSQVSSEHLTSFKFLSYDQKIVLKGLCVKA